MNEFLKDDNWFMWGMDQPWFAWGLALLFVFPLAIVLLGELVNALDRRDSPFSRLAKTIRHLVLPQLVLLLLLTQVFEYHESSTLVRIVETLLYIFAIHTALMFVDILLFHDGTQTGWRAKVPKLVADISRMFLVLFGTAIVLSNVWGFDLGQLLTAMGVGSLVIGLALQDTLGSLFSGFALLSSKQFRVGDWLAVGDHEGKIITMNWRTVTLLTRDEDIIIVPNSDLAKSSFLNYSHPYPRHMERIPFDISFDDPPHKVKRILTEAARQTPGVLTDPPPNCALVSFDEFSIRHELQYFIEDYADQPKIRDSFMSRVWYMAKRENMTFPTRAHDVFMHSPSAASVDVERNQCEEILRRTALLRGKENVIATMAEHSRLLDFGRHEVLIAQDEVPSHLYIIASGLALESYTDINGKEHKINQLEKGDFFGITEMVRHESSTVEITALSDLTVIAVDQNATHTLFEHYPDFGLEMSQLINSRIRAVRNIQQKNRAPLANLVDGEVPSGNTADTQIIDLSKHQRKEG